ncbi:hypothetical protein [Deinococcus sp. RM]|uniref:hypothetical protein n=1 Tax=Deinococcus sp. RM TaxID=2316359 RepID=UPI001F1C6982|nr:hypothetical protein [Deinococcus sp. RM]
MTAPTRAAYPTGFWVLWWGTLINRLGEFVVSLLGFSLLSALYKPAASTAVAELTHGPQRTRADTLLYWAINVGAATAPLLGGWLAGRSARAACEP